jgi:hypothetical protein
LNFVDSKTAFRLFLLIALVIAVAEPIEVPAQDTQPNALPTKAIEIRLLMQIEDDFIDTLHIERWTSGSSAILEDQLNRVLAYLLFSEELDLPPKNVQELGQYSKLKWRELQEDLHQYASRRYGMSRWGDFQQQSDQEQLFNRFRSLFERRNVRIVEKELFERLFPDWQTDSFISQFIRLGFR